MKKVKIIIYSFLFALIYLFMSTNASANETIVEQGKDQMPSAQTDGAYWYNAVWKVNGKNWSKTRVIHDKTLEPRSFFIPSKNENDASIPLYDWRTQPNWQSLNGKWDFKLVDKPEHVITNFHEESFKPDSEWIKMDVPASWQLKNNGIDDEPMYSNWYYHWTQKGYFKIGLKPNIEGEGLNYATVATATAPKNYNPVGHYITNFNINKNNIDDKVILNFQGVESAFYVYVNGKYVGYSEDSFCQHEFDITDLVYKDKPNKLAVLVYRWSDGSFLENQDLVNYSGIFRDVGLIYRSKNAAILDFSNDVSIDSSSNKATLKTKYKVSDDASKVHIKLLDANNNIVSETDAKKENEEFVTYITVENPNLWSVENPYLYKQIISVYDASGNIGEYVGYNVGLREITLQNLDNGKTSYFINGKPLVFKGVNRHELDNEFGRAVRYETIIKDLNLMKQNNVNSIRMSHYPNCVDIYILADIYGIMIMDEANMETHAAGGLNGIPMSVETFRYPSMMRCADMYERDKNFTSVVSWSNGNECIFFAPPKVDDNYSFRIMYKYIKERDSKRPIVLERDPREGVCDIRSRMYWPASEHSIGYSIFEGIPGNDKSILEDTKDKRPYLQVEYAHSMGNSLGYYKEYWDLWRQYPHAMGGFIWDWVDQSPLWPIPKDKVATGPSYDDNGNKVANNGTKYFAYGGDWAKDKNNNFGNFMDNGLISSDRIPHDSHLQMKFVQQDVLFNNYNIDNNTVEIKNEFNFTNLNNFDMSISVLKDGTPVVFDNGSTELPFNLDIEPNTTSSIKLPDFKSHFEMIENAEYYLTIHVRLKNDVGNLVKWANKGYEIAFGEFKLQNIDKTVNKVKINSKLVNNVTNDDNYVEIKNDTFSFKLDKKLGQWIEFSKNGTEFFADKNDGTPEFKTTDKRDMLPGMYANFWRPPVDNDRENQWLNRVSRWRESNFWRKSVNVEVDDKNKNITIIKVDSHFDNNSDLKEIYTIYSDGHVNYQQAIDPTRKSEIPAIGTMFELKNSFNKLTYYGRGPATTFVDRWEGYKHGIYTETVDYNSLGNYVKPQENGNHCDVQWAKITDNDGKGLFVKSNSTNLEIMGSPFNQYDITDKMHPYELLTTNRTYFRVNYKTQGVGGENSWGARPLPYAEIEAKKYSFEYDIFPVGTSSEELYPDKNNDKLYKTIRVPDVELIKEVSIKRSSEKEQEIFNKFNEITKEYYIEYVDGQIPNTADADIKLNDLYVSDYDIIKNYSKDKDGNRTDTVIITLHKKGDDNSSDLVYKFKFLDKPLEKDKLIEKVDYKISSSSESKNLSSFKNSNHQYYFPYADGQIINQCEVGLKLFDNVKDKYKVLYSKKILKNTNFESALIVADIVEKSDETKIIDTYYFEFQGYPYSDTSENIIKKVDIKRSDNMNEENVNDFDEDRTQYVFDYVNGQNYKTATVNITLNDGVKDKYDVIYTREEIDGKPTGIIYADIIDKISKKSIIKYSFKFNKPDLENMNLIKEVDIKPSTNDYEKYTNFNENGYEYTIPYKNGYTPQDAQVKVILNDDVTNLVGVKYIYEKDENGKNTGKVTAEIYELEDESNIIKSYTFVFEPKKISNSNDNLPPATPPEIDEPETPPTTDPRHTPHNNNDNYNNIHLNNNNNNNSNNNIHMNNNNNSSSNNKKKLVDTSVEGDLIIYLIISISFGICIVTKIYTKK